MTGDEKLVQNAAVRGSQLTMGLRALQKRYPVIGDVRGYGLMIGTELVDKDVTKAVHQACLKRDLLLLTCGTYENVIRWIPPLIVTEAQINEALSIFEEALKESF